MTALLALLLAALPAAARAQPAAPAEEPAGVFTNARVPRDEPTRIGRALALAFPATFFAEVEISTAGPVMDLSRLNHDGFYKLELIELLLISRKAGKPLSAAVERRRKGESLRRIAVSWGLDFDALYEAALVVEDIVDRDYLPRFPQRGPFTERDDP